jgi:hypothetical protein
MSTAERKAEMVRDQVIAKIRWGARDQEVLEWLAQKHGITDSEAALLLADAHRAKRNAVRRKALVCLVCASFGLVFGPGLIGVLSLGGFFFSLIALITGRFESSGD